MGARQPGRGRAGPGVPWAAAALRTSFIEMQRGGRRGQVREENNNNARPQNSMKDPGTGTGRAERRMKAVLKSQRTQRSNTNQEAGCQAGRAAPAMQLHLYRGAEGGGGPPFPRKHISISQITASVALVLCSLRLRLAFPARRPPSPLITKPVTAPSTANNGLRPSQASSPLIKTFLMPGRLPGGGHATAAVPYTK